MNEPLVGSIFTHHKTRKFYEVICCAQMEADDSHVVVYRACRLGVEPVEQYGPVWVRPWAEFMDGRFAPAERWQELAKSVSFLSDRTTEPG